MTSENLDGIMRKVAGLIAVADDPATPPAAAETYRAKADALMFQYKIESLITPTGSAATRPTPVWRDIFVCRASNTWRNFYSGIARQIIVRNDLRAQAEWVRNEEDGHQWLVMRCVGYESDLRYAEATATSALAAFGRRLEPAYHSDETDAANALRLRQGGMERKRIAMLLFGGWETENEMKAKNRKVTNLIKEEAKRIGQPHLALELLGRGTNIKTYRESYANAFYSTMCNRLRTHRLAEAHAEHGLVLASAKNIVEEEFYRVYPNLRPKAELESNYYTRNDCEKCKKAKSGYCREHQWLRPVKGRETAYSAAGARAGRTAALSVDLGSPGTYELD